MDGFSVGVEVAGFPAGGTVGEPGSAGIGDSPPPFKGESASGAEAELGRRDKGAEGEQAMRRRFSAKTKKKSKTFFISTPLRHSSREVGGPAGLSLY